MDPLPPSSPTISEIQSPTLQSTSSIPQDPKDPTINNNTSATPYSSQNGSAINNPVPQSSAYLLEEPTLREVMLSDIGVESLVHRLKQSTHTAANLANYIKKRANVENNRIQELRRLTKSTADSIRKTEFRQGTFVKQLGQVLNFDERLFDCTQTFVAALHSMHSELMDLSKSNERSRKSLKEECLRNERNLIDAEQNAEKAKSRYFGLCEDMEKLKDPNRTKLFKSKNTPQHEQELQAKIQNAESEYRKKVEEAQKLRKELINTLRPQSVKQLKDHILECDAGVSYQLQKLVTLNETLLLQQGFILTPLKPAGSATSQLSLKDVVCQIDNELDFYKDIQQLRNSKTLNRPDVQFTQHPYMVGMDKYVSSNTAHKLHPMTSNPVSSAAIKSTGTTSQFNALKPPSQQPSSIGHSKSNSYSGTSMLDPKNFSSQTTNNSPPIHQQSTFSSIDTPISKTTAPPSYLPYPDDDFSKPISGSTKNNSFSEPSYSPPVREDSTVSPVPVVGTPLDPSINAVRSGSYVPTFGSALDDLIEYEALPYPTPIPLIVTKCVGAISQFGMSIEGIYRQQGKLEQIETLKRMFNEDSSKVDLLNPQKYGIDDIHSVAGCLKLYFQSLPDPLLTADYHKDLIQAARIDVDNTRREAIHEVVNLLPDSNYTVLKYLSLHLSKVAQHEAQNRMSLQNLGSMWGPVLMLTTDNEDIHEVALKGRVIETILFFCEEIFEYDDEFFESIGVTI